MPNETRLEELLTEIRDLLRSEIEKRERYREEDIARHLREQEEYWTRNKADTDRYYKFMDSSKYQSFFVSVLHFAIFYIIIYSSVALALVQTRGQ